MALADIINELRSATDQRIADEQKHANVRLAATRSALTSATDEQISRVLADIDGKTQDMSRQAIAHTRIAGRLAIMKMKREYMEKAYARALEQLVDLSSDETEAFLKVLIDACPEEGTLHPSKAHVSLIQKLAGARVIGTNIEGCGGFIFSSATCERDCRYETLMRDILRPATTLFVARTLFPMPA